MNPVPPLHLLIALVVTICASNGFSADTDNWPLVLQLQTKLNEQATVHVSETATLGRSQRDSTAPMYDSANDVRYISSILTQLDNGRTVSANLVVELSEGVFILIPWKLLKHIGAEGKKHVVTLSDGTRYMGKPLTSVKDKSGNLFPLGSCKEVTVVRQSLKRMTVSANPTQFDMKIANSVTLSEPVSCVAWYWCECVGWPRYNGIGFELQQRGYAFEVLVNGEPITGNLPSFQEILFRKDTKTDHTLMRVRAPSAEAVEGRLVIPSCDHSWALAFVTRSGCTVVISHPKEVVVLSRRQ